MFRYQGNYSRLILATEKANEIISNGKLFNAVALKENFDMTDVDGEFIVERMREFIASGKVVNVKTYKSRNPWSKALGYFSSSRPLDINLNTRKLNRSQASFTNTLIHEFCHMLDNYDDERYGHGDNSAAGKQNTVPYWVGKQAGNIVSNTPTVDYYGAKKDGDNTVKYYRASRWTRVKRWFRRIFK